MPGQPLDRERGKLQELLIEHWEVKKWFDNDATVHSWLKMVSIGHCTLEEAYIGILCHLAREKKHYFDKVVELSMLQPPAPIVLPKNNKLVNGDGK